MDLNQIISQLTLEEKAQLCSGKSNWETHTIERPGIPSMIMMDGPHGLRYAIGDEFGNSKPSTCFPSASCMASSWDIALLEEVGTAIGKECQSAGVQILLGPGVNMKRSPLGGRNFEYYSEDPVLSGEMAAAFINGVQGQGVGTSLKHFTANNQEFERMVNSSNVDMRTLREIYFPAFKIAVTKAQPWSVMCAYNAVNGVFASESKFLLTDVLRSEWNFKGFVVSDWAATYDRVASLKAGLNLEMPANIMNAPKIIEAVKTGQLAEAELDKALLPLLEIIFKADKLRKNTASFNEEEHHNLARKVAAESMVLLKNTDDLLPLKRSYNRVAVIGGFANRPRFQGGGSSEINPTKLDNPLDEIRNYLSDDTDLLYLAGYDKQHKTNDVLLDEAVSFAEGADIAIIFAGLPDHFESEAFDRKHMDMPESHIKLINEITQVNENVIVVLSNGSCVTAKPWEKNVKAILEGWLGGQAGGGAIADILFGEVNPSGKLSETFPLKLEDNPSYLSFPGANRNVNYDEKIFIGYRYYDTKKMEVTFPFGFGLSYTIFEYSDLKLSAKSISDEGALTVSLKVKNMGDRAGKEIVQIYLKDEISTLPRPEKELKGFSKVHLEPGEQKTVSFNLEEQDFSFYDPELSSWITETGGFKILIGASSRDIRLEGTVHFTSKSEELPIYDKYSSFGEILNDDRRSEIIKPIVEGVATAMGEDFGKMSEKDFMYHILMAMPLAKLVNFGRGAFSEKDIEGLIQKLNNVV